MIRRTLGAELRLVHVSTVLTLMLIVSACSNSAPDRPPRSATRACYGTFQVKTISSPAFHVHAQDVSTTVSSFLTFGKTGKFSGSVANAGFQGRFKFETANQITWNGVTSDGGASDGRRFPVRLGAENVANSVIYNGQAQVHCSSHGMTLTRDSASLGLQRAAGPN